MPAHTQTFKSLHWTSLDPEQHAKTCGYWYIITAYGGAPHTAFATRDAFLAWAARLGLAVDADTVPHAGTWSHGRIAGDYCRASHIGTRAVGSIEYVGGYDEFWALQGPRVRVMDNGDVTTGIITTDADGKRTLHHLNPNMRDRPVFPRDVSTAEGY